MWARIGSRLALGVLVLAAGCNDADGTGDEAADGDAAPVSIQIVDNAFDPDTVDVAAGRVNVALENAGQLSHTFTITDLDVDQTVGSGESATVEFDADPGSYDFVCTFHPGMAGTLTVGE